MNTSGFSTVLRVLPSSGRSCLSAGSNDQKIVFKDENDSSNMVMPGSVDGEFREFHFDGVFHNADQLSFFKQTVKVTVEQMLQGYHGTVFALGARGTGARYTMRGPSFGSEMQLRSRRGAMLRAVELVFHCLRRSASRATKGLVVIVSYFTIRNEVMFDLFGQGGEATEVVLDQFGELRGLSEHVVSSVEDVERLLQKAYKMEQELADKVPGGEVGSGNAVFTITVEHGNLGKTFAPISGVLRLVELSDFSQLADDASQQSSSSTLPEGLADKSLLALLQIIRKVAELQMQHQPVAFRPENCSSRLAEDSQGDSSGKVRSPEVEKARKLLSFQQSLLTRLVGESVGGNSKTLLVCHVSSEASDSQITGRLLQLASTAQLITNYPDRRDLAEQALMSAYLRELRQNYRHVVFDCSDNATTDIKSPTREASTSPREKKHKGKRKSKKRSLPAGEVVWNPEIMGKGAVSRRKSELALSSWDSQTSGDDTLIPGLMEHQGNDTSIGPGASAESAAEALAAAAALVEEADLAAPVLEEEAVPDEEKEKNCEPSGSLTQEKLNETQSNGSHGNSGQLETDSCRDVGQAAASSAPKPHKTDFAKNTSDGIAAEVGCENSMSCNSVGESSGLTRVPSGKDKTPDCDSSNGRTAQFVHPNELMNGLNLSANTLVEAPVPGVLDDRHDSHDLDSKEANLNHLEKFEMKAGDSVSEAQKEGSFHKRERTVLQRGEALSSVDEDTRVGEDISVGEAIGVQFSLSSVQEAVAGADSEVLLKLQEMLADSITGVFKPNEEDSMHGVEVSSGKNIVEWLLHHVTGLEGEDGAMRLAEELLHCGLISHLGNDNRVFSAFADYCLAMAAGSVVIFSDAAEESSNTAIPASVSSQMQSKDDYYMSSVEQTAYQGEGYEDLVYDYATGQPYVPQVTQMQQDSSPLEKNIINQRYISLEPFNPDRVARLSDKLHPFHAACATGQNPLMLHNLAIMFGVDLCDLNGRSALMYGVLSNKPKCIAELLECGAALDRVDASGFTALLHAVYFDFVPVVQELLSHEECRNIIGNADPDGLTVVHWATKLESRKCLQLLLRCCLPGHVNMMDNLCQTPLYLAIAQDRHQHVQLLLQNSGDSSAVDGAHTPANHLAVACHAPRSLKTLLLMQKNTVNAVDATGQTALHVACKQRCGECFDIILAAAGKKWPGLLVVDGQQRSALHCAVEANCPGLVKELLVRGSSISVCDSDGLTALQYAEKTNNMCLPVLREAAAAIAAGKRYTGGKQSSICTIS